MSFWKYNTYLMMPKKYIIRDMIKRNKSDVGNIDFEILIIIIIIIIITSIYGAIHQIDTMALTRPKTLNT